VSLTDAITGRSGRPGITHREIEEIRENLIFRISLLILPDLL
jgi:hypothetical protein